MHRTSKQEWLAKQALFFDALERTFGCEKVNRYSVGSWIGVHPRHAARIMNGDEELHLWHVNLWARQCPDGQITGELDNFVYEGSGRTTIEDLDGGSLDIDHNGTDGDADDVKAGLLASAKDSIELLASEREPHNDETHLKRARRLITRVLAIVTKRAA